MREAPKKEAIEDGHRPGSYPVVGRGETLVGREDATEANQPGSPAGLTIVAAPPRHLPRSAMEAWLCHAPVEHEGPTLSRQEVVLRRALRYGGQGGGTPVGRANATEVNQPGEPG